MTAIMINVVKKRMWRMWYWSSGGCWNISHYYCFYCIYDHI